MRCMIVLFLKSTATFAGAPSSPVIDSQSLYYIYMTCITMCITARSLKIETINISKLITNVPIIIG